jgi:hypothetical protein
MEIKKPEFEKWIRTKKSRAARMTPKKWRNP